MKSEVKKCEECYKTLKIRFIVLSLLKILYQLFMPLYSLRSKRFCTV